jgi:hypothetical protein
LSFKQPDTALEPTGIGRFIFIHKRFLVAGHRRSPMSQLFSLSIAATAIEYGDLFAQIVIYAPEFMQLAF